MIALQNISKHFGVQQLFSDVTVTINSGERIGLVGRNGHGKTTLLRILAGQLEPDSGSVSFPNSYRIGYLEQQLRFEQETLLAEGCMALAPDERQDSWKVARVLSGLGFSEEDFDKPITRFSGGYQMRLNLAKVLVAEPDLLLLDEPTNFLDILSIRFLERFLRGWRGEVILISHDRAFMDSVCTHIMGVHRGVVRKIAGSTQDYYNLLSGEEELYEKRRLSLEKKRRETEQFINKFRAKARQANLVQSRIKTLEKQEALEKLEKVEQLGFSFRYHPCNARLLLDGRDLGFAYPGGEPLFSGLSLSAAAGECLCIVGPNGAGKTTLLRILAGELEQSDGSLRMHPEVRAGYFAQANTARLDPRRSVLEELQAVQEQPDPQAARNVAGLMMFTADNALKPVEVLSGGEQCRVLIGRIILSPVNLLLLDEPTHHLDMESCEALAEAVEAFPGATIMVTHDERLLGRLATRLVVFRSGGASLFEGTYDQFLEERGWDEDTHEQQGMSDNSNAQRLSRKDERRLRAQRIAERSKKLKPLERQMQQLEQQIETLELEIHGHEQQLIEASHSQNASAISDLSQLMQQSKDRVWDLYEKLDTVMTEYEQRKAEIG